MNILITGGLGYLGSHTAIALAEAGHRIVLLDNLSNSQLIVHEKIQKILGCKIIFIEGDIRDGSLLKNIMVAHSIHCVVHFAGLKSIGDSLRIPADYYDVNVTGSISLTRAMSSAGCKSMVFSSSATVYGIPKYLPCDEFHPINPQSPYGRTKSLVEQFLTDVAAADQGWSIAALRYFNPAGAHSSALIGEAPIGLPNNLMPYLSMVASGKLERLYVYGDDYETVDGTGMRDYIHVMDLAEAHVLACEYLNDKKTGFRVFNLGAGRGITVLEMLDAYEKACGAKINRKVVERRPGDVAISYADVVLARDELGWSASRSISDICNSAWNWQKGIDTQ